MSKDKNYIDFDDDDENDDLNMEDIEIIDEEELEEIIEIPDEDYDIEDDDFDGESDEHDDDFNDDFDNSQTKEEKFDLLYHFNTNKHRQEGKHRLKRDTIFKGKLDKKPDEEGYMDQDDYGDITTFFDYESEQYSNNIDQNNLTKDVYGVLKEETDLDFKQNRRKPNKETFNNYYNLLLKELGFRYTKSEIFVELSYYFTDNIFNMFKLLDKRPATIIIKELTQKGYLKDLDGINFL